MRAAVILAIGVIALSNVQATPLDYIIPSDIAVSLSADKTTDLHPGEVITFTLAATNVGNQPAFPVVLASSHFVDEFNFVSADCVLVTVVADGKDFYEYWFTWYAAALPGAPPILPGDSRICRFQFALTTHAPAVYPFTFGLPSFFTDPNPDNDNATVVLRRGDLAAHELPVDSPIVLLLLALGMMVIGGYETQARFRKLNAGR